MNSRQPADEAVTIRIVDASLNRAAEALRVIEDIARFALDDRLLTNEAKDLRHEITWAVHRALPPPTLLAVRNTLHDVGTQIRGAMEYQRPAWTDVLASNFQRSQQASRSLEECMKLVAAEQAACLEQLRYRLYTLEKCFASLIYGRQQLDDISVCVLVDGGPDAANFRGRIDRLITAGRMMIQLRDPTWSDGELLSRTRDVVEAARNLPVIVIVNDRADVAAIAGADGVHLGQADMPVHAARRVLGPRAIIGVSTHSLNQAKQAVRDGATYIGVGPVFPSSTKGFDSVIGVETVRAVSREMTLPHFAIGGITLDNLGQVLAAGACRVAVQQAIWSAEDPRQAWIAFHTALPGE